MYKKYTLYKVGKIGIINISKRITEIMRGIDKEIII